MQLKVLFGRKSHDARTFRERKQQQSRVFFDVVEEPERVIENKGARISLEEKLENLIAAVRK